MTTGIIKNTFRIDSRKDGGDWIEVRALHKHVTTWDQAEPFYEQERMHDFTAEVRLVMVSEHVGRVGKGRVYL